MIDTAEGGDALDILRLTERSEFSVDVVQSQREKDFLEERGAADDILGSKDTTPENCRGYSTQ
jgi:hypothetical protein